MKDINDLRKKYYNPDIMLKVVFEDKENFEDLTPEMKRYDQLTTIYDYAVKYGLTDVANYVLSVKDTDESSLVSLEKIGFTFDGNVLSKIKNDNISFVPTKRTKNVLPQEHDVFC